MQFHPLEADISLSRKLREKVTTAPPIKLFSPKVDKHLYIRIMLNIKFREILGLSSQATLAAKFCH